MLTERMRAFERYLRTLNPEELTESERAALTELYVELIAFLKGTT